VLISDLHFPKDLAEALDTMAAKPGILVLAGCSGVLREQGGRGLSLPDNVLYVRDLPELRRAGLSERFLEIGAAVTLSELLELGEAALPPLLAEAARKVGTPAIRNLATIGGNLAERERFMDTWPALACLDALAELRDKGGSTWMNVNRLVGEDKRPAFPEGALLTRLRVPIVKWDAWALKKVGSPDYPSPDTAVFAFAAKVEKGILSDIRVIFAGEIALRSHSLEASLIGTALPLSRKETDQAKTGYRELAASLGPGLDPGLALQLDALIDEAFGLLSR
jgi:CO/xanthine dehydrogenase FAD-binding subunit